MDTTLTQDVSLNAGVWPLASTDGVEIGMFGACGTEQVRVTGVIVGVGVAVVRGYNATTATTHTSGDAVTIDAAATFATPSAFVPPPGVADTVLTSGGPQAAESWEPGGGGGFTPPVTIPDATTIFQNGDSDPILATDANGQPVLTVYPSGSAPESVQADGNNGILVGNTAVGAGIFAQAKMAVAETGNDKYASLTLDINDGEQANLIVGSGASSSSVSVQPAALSLTTGGALDLAPTGNLTINSTAGITTTFVDADGNTITVTKGLITAKVGP